MEPKRRSPYLCCECVLFRALLSAVALLCVGALAMLLGGALLASAPLYVGGALMLSAGAALALLALWMSRRGGGVPVPLRFRCHPKVVRPEVWTVPDYYSRMPPGRVSDYPMGPNLVMTLPERKPSRPHRTPPSKLTKARPKNVPPLASAETLSPSILTSSSGCGSIDSVV